MLYCLGMSMLVSIERRKNRNPKKMSWQNEAGDGPNDKLNTKKGIKKYQEKTKPLKRGL